FLGVDAPEISFQPPANNAFIELKDPRWEAVLADPFAANLPPFNPPLDAGLQAALQARVGPGTAANHFAHAKKAKDELVRQVKADQAVLGKSDEAFEFFLAFASDVIDRYGRLLAYINRAQPDDHTPEPRPLTYNERLLKAGLITPYFIWPNVNPFRRQAS